MPTTAEAHGIYDLGALTARVQCNCYGILTWPRTVTVEYSKLYNVEQQGVSRATISSRFSITAILEDLGLDHSGRQSSLWLPHNSSRSVLATRLWLGRIGLDALEKRRQQQHLILMYKIMHGTVALTPADLGLLPADHHTRTTHIHKLRHQQSNTKELLHSFIPRTITEWNCLPASLAEAGSLETFKSQLSASRVV